jgi:hypothetical protein
VEVLDETQQLKVRFSAMLARGSMTHFDECCHD